MIRTNTERNYPRQMAGYAKKNTALLLLALLFLAGVTLGAVLLRHAGGETAALLERLTEDFLQNRRGQSLGANFLWAAGSSLMFVGVLFVCGFCAIAHPAEILAVFFRGLGFGASAASLYAGFGARAAGFLALFVLPNMLLSSVAILFCCRESLRLSSRFFAAMFPDGEAQTDKYPLRYYLGRYAAAMLLCLISALLEAVMYLGFAKYLVLG